MRDIFNSRIFIRLSLILYMIVIFTLSSLTFKDTVSGFMLNDKLIHFTEYAILGFLLMKYFSINRFKDINISSFLTFITGALYAASDEIHQGFVGYFGTGIFGGLRDPDPLDFLADVAGISFIILIFLLMHRRMLLKTNLQE
jgi:VanZ family protein